MFGYTKDEAVGRSITMIFPEERIDEEDMTVAGEAADGREAVQLARKHQPDVIIMDVNMPELNGIEATRMVVADNPGTRVIGLSFHEEQKVAKSMHQAGAAAYLTKSDVFETLCATIRSEAQALDEAMPEEE